jgi:YD repeat-containing protein
MSLVGADGDLVDFIPGKITRTNTPGEYQSLATRYEGTSIGAGTGCAACAYDQLGNPLAETNPRGFTTHMLRNELGEVYRTIGPDPYRYQTETYYDANRNVIRFDTQDQYVEYALDDPTSACFAQFTPTGSETTANVPSRPGFGGSIRPGWFTDTKTYNLLDRVIEENRDATGSQPDRLITLTEYDPNQNPIKITKPEGNTVEFDYDERDLQIAVRVGDSPDTPAITVTAYDANGNVLQVIGPARRGAAGNEQTVIIEDAFRSAATLTHTGDFELENDYDGFDRVVTATDAVGNVASMLYDPGDRTVEATAEGPIGGTTPTNRTGSGNVDLAQSEMRFDEAGRQYESQRDVFVANTTGAGPLPGARDITHTGGGLETNSTADGHTAAAIIYNTGGANQTSYVLTRTVFDRANRVVQTLADNTGVAANSYDGANRRIESTDAVGNVQQFQYDNNGNVTQVTRVEKSTVSGPQTVPDETFVSVRFYDSLDRPVLSAVQGADGKLDPALIPCDSTAIWQVPSSALITLTGYDSRNNRTLAIDPKRNTTVTVYDGASRPTQLQEHLRQKGQGQNPPAAGSTLLPFGGSPITTITVYDGNGRTRQLVDDNGAVTAYEYDTLDREVTMIFPDSSTRENVYNTASNVTQHTDENGSVL